MFGSLLRSRPVIDNFEGPYAFLSNAYRHRRPVSEIVGPATLRYPTVMHAMVGAQYGCLGEKLNIAQVKDPFKLTIITRGYQKIDLKPHERQKRLMELLREKFECPDLREKLIATGNASLKAAGEDIQRALETVREEVLKECSTTKPLNPFSGIGANSFS